MNDDDEPRPELAGTSATLVSSMPLVTPVICSASRKMRCSILSTSGDDLGLRVREADVVVEALVRRDVDVLVDRRRDEIAAELLVVGGDVGAAAAEGEAHGGARDDHGSAFRWRGLSGGRVGEFPVELREGRFPSQFRRTSHGRDRHASASRAESSALNAIEPPRDALRGPRESLAAQRRGAVVDVIESRVIGAFLVTRDPQLAVVVNAD